MAARKILIADDHDVVRRGVRTLLEAQPDWEVCGEAGNGHEAVAMAAEHKPDVAILDITMPKLNGLEATRQIRKAAPKTEVLILTIHESEQVIREALQAGARGCVLKSDAGRDLVAAVEALLQHQPFFTSRVSGFVLEDYLAQAHNGTSHSPLTPREREVLQLLAEGSSNKEVAATLNISVKTVETHRANMMRALGLHTIGELTRYAIRNRLIEP